MPSNIITDQQKEALAAAGRVVEPDTQDTLDSITQPATESIIADILPKEEPMISQLIEALPVDEETTSAEQNDTIKKDDDPVKTIVVEEPVQVNTATEPISQESPTIDDSITNDVELPILGPLTLSDIVTKPIQPQNSIQDYDQTLKKNQANEREIHIHLPGQLSNEVQRTIVSFLRQLIANKEQIEVPEEYQDWVATVADSVDYLTVDDMLRPTVEKPNTKFRQGVVNEVSNKVLKGRTLPNGLNRGGANMMGSKALESMRTHMGYGGNFYAPLWHSGFWLQFTAPSERDYTVLQQRLNSESIRFGRGSYGILHGAMTVYCLKSCVEFALKFCTNTNIKGVDPKNTQALLALISEHDYPTVLWGVMGATYAHGFNYSQSCLADPGKCTYVAEEVLNVSGLQKVDALALTRDQKVHMSSQDPQSVSIDKINDYRNTLVATQDRVVSVKLDDTVFQVTLAVPNLGDKILSCQKWIDSIITEASAILTQENSTGREREEFYRKLANSSALRIYEHYVKSIEWGIGDTPNITTDRDTISTFLENWSTYSVIVDNLLTEIYKYINESTISLIGVYSIDCPVCNKGNNLTEENVYPKLRNIVPIDVLQTFFTMVEQKINRINNQ